VGKVKVVIEYNDDVDLLCADNQNQHEASRPRAGDTTSHGKSTSPPPTLQPVEAQVLLSVLAGPQNTLIAGELRVDEAAVKEHLKAILRKVRGH
jgi:DNA-binding NarL/FixJ family response regulator